MYSEILYKCTNEEKSAVGPIMERAEDIFSCIKSKNDMNDKTDALSRYYFDKEMASEEHMLGFITAKLEEQTGMMWVAYYRKGFNSNGKIVTGSGSESEKVLARWKLKQINDSWIVIDVNEAP